MTDYDPSYAARARDLCYVGAPDIEIARLLGVSLSTLTAWREKYPAFNYAWEDGQYHASGRVINALLKKACGYTYVKWKDTQHGMMQEQVHVEPSIPACIFWLTNKHPDHWKTKVEHDIGEGGKIVANALTEIEAARRVAFALSKAMHESTRRIEDGSSRTTPTETE